MKLDTTHYCLMGMELDSSENYYHVMCVIDNLDVGYGSWDFKMIHSWKSKYIGFALKFNGYTESVSQIPDIRDVQAFIQHQLPDIKHNPVGLYMVVETDP